MTFRFIALCAALAITGVQLLALSENLIASKPSAALAPPDGFATSGGVDFRYLGDAHRDISGNGFAMESAKPSGEVSRRVNVNAADGRWYRFTFRGLPQENFAVKNDSLFMRVAFFGQGGKISYDEKEKRIGDLIDIARRDFTVNGVRHQHGAEVWRTYQLDFMLPFPQVDTVEVAVRFDHGNAKTSDNSAFFIDDMQMIRIPEPANLPSPSTQPRTVETVRKPIAIGGRWFYSPNENEEVAPKKFDSSNVDRLLYFNGAYSAPFAGNTSAILRAGFMDEDGNVVKKDRTIDDNVKIEFTSTQLVVHTHGIPNHPTGKFPEEGFGNPSYIQEQRETYYIPLEPKENPRHTITTTNNSNHALPMGPIGIAINGVVFFNPFDMGNQDATDLMDRCCGHPNQDGQYHYHKYPICVNSPWADEGRSHSPLLGFAFDGFPIYGPYESADVMAKDVRGQTALNGFNMHYDAQRGWHYHVTPGKFPYLIGGYWGSEDAKDMHGPPGGGGGNGPPRGGNRPPMGGPPPWN